MTPDERELRARIGASQCIVDGEQFYIRGLLEIPIHNSKEKFLWGLWASVFEHDYDEMEDTWELVGRDRSFGPCKARLANSLRVYPETLHLKVSVALQSVGLRPLIVVDEPEHLLASAQRQGMTTHQVFELVQRLLA